ncbi:MAG: calcium-binding protein [Synechococcales cyanobacterium RM1_1_8]|nr:calcium-binding protein [Synechococcales cyanobacterium RM1_1_8]
MVTLHNKTISVWNPGGSLRSQTSLVRSYVNDLAIDPTSGKLYVTGFDNKYNSLDRNPVQVAFLTGFDLDLNVNWQTWGQDANSLTLPVTTPQGDRPQNDMADTRGYRITVGRDGGLYFLGEVAGGNSIFRWNGKDRTTATQVKYDAYNDPYNSASPHQAYYARINAQTGEVMQGQLAFPRYNGAANAFRVDQGTIAADEQGNIYVGGVTFSGVDGRDNNAIAGQSVGSYVFRREGDLTALVVSSDFQQRRLWTPFTDNGGKGKVQGFAVGQGRAALFGTVVEGTTITASALHGQAFNPGTSALADAYLATWAIDSPTGFATVQYGTAGADHLVGGATADLLIGGLGADTLQGDSRPAGGGFGGGADVFAYNAVGEGGDRILDFQTQDHIRISASGFGLAAGSQARLASSSQALGSSAGFVYSGGLLSFDGDGAGSQATVGLATLVGTPSLSASQIQIV